MNGWEFGADTVFAGLIAFGAYLGVVLKSPGERRCSLAGHTWETIKTERISVYDTSYGRKNDLPDHFTYVYIMRCTRCGKIQHQKKKV